MDSPFVHTPRDKSKALSLKKDYAMIVSSLGLIGCSSRCSFAYVCVEVCKAKVKSKYTGTYLY